MPVFLDLPGEAVDTIPCSVQGWIASQAESPAVSLRVGGRPVGFTLFPRPEVAAMLPGFATVLGVSGQAYGQVPADGGTMLVELECDGEVVTRTCRVAAGADIWGRPKQVALRRRHRAWCLGQLRCPTCHAGPQALSRRDAEIVCTVCNTVYPQEAAALTLFTAASGLAAGVEDTANVSANPYTPEAESLISSVTGRGGWVLDCGAGSRPVRQPGVINMEIVDYPSTDVLAIGEALPFADGSFDAVLSLAVLEHVRDPFTCAREIMRVLKPGGELLADVPFLQPLHGFPNHYYNMTQSGLRHLFDGIGVVESVHVPQHGHPIIAAHWFLNQYLRGLPPAERTRFAAMTVGEIAATPDLELLLQPHALQLHDANRTMLACLNSARVRKPG